MNKLNKNAGNTYIVSHLCYKKTFLPVLDYIRQKQLWESDATDG